MPSLRWWFGLTLGGLLALACHRPAPRPNIVFILIDTLREDMLPGNAPHLDELARDGVRFDRVIAASSWTKTSMASILTSQTPLRHGVRTPEDALPEGLATLPEELAAAGYRTLAVNANPWLTEEFGFETGFDRYETRHLAPAKEINAAALTLLQENPERPAFLYLHYMDVHAPYTPSEAYFSEPPVRIPGQGVLPDTHVEIAYRKSGLHSKEAVARVRALYRAEIRELDAAIGELLRDLAEEGFLEDALIIATSDHGEAFLEHGTTVHGKNYYPEVYRVPLIMKWAGHIPSGRRIASLTRSIDIAPTIVDLLGLSPPPGFEGRSLLPFDPESGPEPDRVSIGAVGLNDYRPEQDYVGVVSRDFLYVVERRSGEVEFYDLRVDPGAQRNLGADHREAARHAAYIAASSAAPAEKSEKVEIDSDTRQQLKELGYLPGDD